MAEIIYEPVPNSKLLGMARAISGIRDAVAIVHGKSCCHADTLLFNVLTGLHDDIRVVGSGIRSQDISVGGYRKLALAIRSAYQEFRPRLIAVLVTSFTTLMGDDVEGIIQDLRQDVPCETCSFACPGFMGDSVTGYAEVLSFLVRYMEECAPERGKINIIGFKPDDPHARADLEEIRRMLRSHGIGINAVLAGSPFDEIKTASRASLNVVVSQEGIQCSRLMKEMFKTPYVEVPYPFGWKGSVEFLVRVGDALNIGLDQDQIQKEKAKIRERLQTIYTYLQGIYGLGVGVVGDSARVGALARFLGSELGLDIKVVCVTRGGAHEIDRQLGFERIVISQDQFEVEQALRDKDISLVFGSTMEKRICRELGIPLVRIFYPVLDEISISYSPYAGFDGVTNLAEKIINAIICEG